MNVQLEKELKRRNSKLSLEEEVKEKFTEEVKKNLQQSHSSNRRITADYTLNLSSPDSCVQSYKELHNVTESDKRNVLLNSAKQCKILKYKLIQTSICLF